MEGKCYQLCFILHPQFCPECKEVSYVLIDLSYVKAQLCVTGLDCFFSLFSPIIKVMHIYCRKNVKNIEK